MITLLAYMWGNRSWLLTLYQSYIGWTACNRDSQLFLTYKTSDFIEFDLILISGEPRSPDFQVCDILSIYASISHIFSLLKSGNPLMSPDPGTVNFPILIDNERTTAMKHMSSVYPFFSNSLKSHSKILVSVQHIFKKSW